MRRKARRELERLHVESAQILKEARVQADSIITQTRSDGERLREEMRQKARAEADTIIRTAERQIQLETARALQQIRHEAADLSVMIASKLIQRNLSKEDNERLIEMRCARWKQGALAASAKLLHSQSDHTGAGARPPSPRPCRLRAARDGRSSVPPPADRPADPPGA